MELNDIIQQRIDKLRSFKEAGFDPYGKKFDKTSSIKELLSFFKENEKVVLAGRLMAKRKHGKVCFADLRDQEARLQLYVRKDDPLTETDFELFNKLDIGDIVGVEGETFKTHTGEPTLKVARFTLLSKSLRPLPEKWHGLKDIQIRYRQRYIDLIASPEVREIFIARSKIISAIRDFLNKKGFLEVETPMMHTIPGGAAGRPFKTHHNEYAMQLYLRIAPELYLKRLIVGGFEKIYEINRSFRNEGVSTRHNPEFTMLELYAAYCDYEDMMKMTEDIFAHVAQAVLGKLEIEYQGQKINLTPPWPRRSFARAVKENFGIEPQDEARVMIEKLKKKGRPVEDRLTRSQIVKLVEEILTQDAPTQPVFFTEYFSVLCPLAKNKKEDPLISDRFELYVAGMEVANAYSELNDPIEQKLRLQEEIKDDVADGRCLDEDFVEALEYGMPPTGGLGIGIDRLCMLLLDQASIRDVILFPLLRPDKT
ncbi:MAG: lysine--tRNA ligase [Candidatus Omnitrophica bacterium CG1_02_44_16]|nr:MAG: lysine--tRNA ligase [Candidatus Omnitrophica bacterium CG1_02_44_16]